MGTIERGCVKRLVATNKQQNRQRAIDYVVLTTYIRIHTLTSHTQTHTYTHTRCVFDPISTIWAFGASKSGKMLPSKQRPCGDDEDNNVWIYLPVDLSMTVSSRLSTLYESMHAVQEKNPPSPRADGIFVSFFFLRNCSKSSKLFVRSHTDHILTIINRNFSTHWRLPPVIGTWHIFISTPDFCDFSTHRQFSANRRQW